MEQQHQLSLVGRQLSTHQTKRTILLGQDLQHYICQLNIQKHRISEFKSEGQLSGTSSRIADYDLSLTKADQYNPEPFLIIINYYLNPRFNMSLN